MTAIMLGSSGAQAASVVDLVSLVTHQVTGTRDTSAGAGTATAIWILQSDGNATEASNIGTGTDSISAAAQYNLTDWFLAKLSGGIGSSWECRWNLDSTLGAGTFTTPVAANTWIDISVARTWQLQSTGNNVEIQSQRVMTVEIRDVATQTIQAVATITLNANLFGP